MIDMRVVNEGIEILEGQGFDYDMAMKLAALYQIKDHFRNYGEHTEPENAYPESDTAFMTAVRRKSLVEVMELMDELMNALSVVNPKLYDSVMRKLV